MKSILDKTFKYTPAVETDLRKTFARVRREQKAAADSLDLLQDRTLVLNLVPGVGKAMIKK